MTHAPIPATTVVHTATPSRSRPLATLAIAASLLAGPALGLAQPAAASTPSASVVELRASVVDLTNVARAAEGCKTLKTNKSLTNAAQGHAEDMAANRYFDHTSADGRTWDQRIRAAGWKKPGGENIAYGYDTPTAVVEGWMNSPGHRRNILDCKFNYIGIGYSANGDYWVQNFGQ